MNNDLKAAIREIRRAEGLDDGELELTAAGLAAALAANLRERLRAPNEGRSHFHRAIARGYRSALVEMLEELQTVVNKSQTTTPP